MYKIRQRKNRLGTTMVYIVDSQNNQVGDLGPLNWTLEKYPNGIEDLKAILADEIKAKELLNSCDNLMNVKKLLDERIAKFNQKLAKIFEARYSGDPNWEEMDPITCRHMWHVASMPAKRLFDDALSDDEFMQIAKEYGIAKNDLVDWLWKLIEDKICRGFNNRYDKPVICHEVEFNKNAKMAPKPASLLSEYDGKAAAYVILGALEDEIEKAVAKRLVKKFPTEEPYIYGVMSSISLNKVVYDYETTCCYDDKQIDADYYIYVEEDIREFKTAYLLNSMGIPLAIEDLDVMMDAEFVQEKLELAKSVMKLERPIFVMGKRFETDKFIKALDGKAGYIFKHRTKSFKPNNDEERELLELALKDLKLMESPGMASCHTCRKNGMKEKLIIASRGNGFLSIVRTSETELPEDEVLTACIRMAELEEFNALYKKRMDRDVVSINDMSQVFVHFLINFLLIGVCSAMHLSTDRKVDYLDILNNALEMRTAEFCEGVLQLVGDSNQLSIWRQIGLHPLMSKIPPEVFERGIW